MSYAVITGASSGIGREFARLLSQKGYSLVLVARRVDRLEELKKELKCDCIALSHDLADVNECYKLLDEIKNLDVEMFINNAGFGIFSQFENMANDRVEAMIDVNVKALTVLTKSILEVFKKKNKGKIINVASSAGLLPAGPYMAEYYATKSYVTSLTQGIAIELKNAKSKVYIGALCPGPVDTEFNNVADVRFSLKGITPRYCAKYCLKMANRGKTLIVPKGSLRMAIFFQRFFSRRFYAKLIARQQRKKGDI